MTGKYATNRLEEGHCLTGDAEFIRAKRRNGRSRMLRLAVVPLLGLLALAYLSITHCSSQQWLTHTWSSGHRSKKVNIIFMISDGYGPASETFGRAFFACIHDGDKPEQHSPRHSERPANQLPHTPLDKILVGSHRSASSDSLITDSAAGATAFSCAKKSYNGAIGVDASKEACGTVFEAAKAAGWATGVVVTSRLTDATPASFISHVESRAQEPLIALHSLGLSPEALNLSAPALGPGKTPLSPPLDLAIGGGGCLYLPMSHPSSCRQDLGDLVAEASSRGWHVKMGHGFRNASRSGTANMRVFHDGIQGSAALSAEGSDESAKHDFLASLQRSSTPLLALLSPANTPFEIDRQFSEVNRAAFPSLKSLALTAIDLLTRSKSNKKGFVLMVEGSQIDLCAHANDPACHAREIVAYQQAINAVHEWVDEANKRGEKTVLISTSDHETGGLTLGRQLTAAYPNYAYYPSRLIPARKSATALSAQLVSFVTSSRSPPTKEQVKRFVVEESLGKNGAGLTGPGAGGPATDAEVERVLHCIGHSQPLQDPPINTADECRKVFADIMSRRAELGWSTSGHTGVDVPVHAAGWRSAELAGNIENTDVGKFMERVLGVSLQHTTRDLLGRRS
ncbi:Alkaline phosphatase [Ceraceosorus bombacis]|uniref:Alkaline phosphatase n=1 Tax=Ceraceosorus bombacis TaxID=401625 RepID=A0A0P1BCM0_9BASI|nr:Alkaline phosphatase [Ceraceosorus bombacis]